MGSRRAATAAVADRRGALAAIRRESIWGSVSGQLAAGVWIDSEGHVSGTRETCLGCRLWAQYVGGLKLSLNAPT